MYAECIGCKYYGPMEGLTDEEVFHCTIGFYPDCDENEIPDCYEEE